MRRIRALVAIAALAILTVTLASATPASNYCLSVADLIANQSGNYTWKTSAPATSQKLVSWGDFQGWVNTQACSVSNVNYIMSWNDIISCSSSHTVAQQSLSVSGNYHTIYYTATYNASLQVYTCRGPFSSDGYTGTPITLPAGTVAPTSSSTQLALTLSNIAYYGSTSISVALLNPSGTQVWSQANITASSFTATPYFAAGAPAGAWQWQITQIGGSDGSCDSTNGPQGGRNQMTFSGTTTWYQ